MMRTNNKLSQLATEFVNSICATPSLNKNIRSNKLITDGRDGGAKVSHYNTVPGVVPYLRQ